MLQFKKHKVIHIICGLGASICDLKDQQISTVFGHQGHEVVICPVVTPLHYPPEFTHQLQARYPDFVSL